MRSQLWLRIFEKQLEGFSMAKKEISKKDRVYKRKRRRRQFVALLVIFLMVVGVASIVTIGTRGVMRLFDDSGDKVEYQKLIAPLVALDPSPFNSIDNANPNTLLEAAIWATITGEDTTKYARTETGQIILPAIDVTNYATKMYGPSYTLNHRTITQADIEYEYREANQAYVIPITSLSSSYTPVIENITTHGNTKILRVGYAQQSGSSGEIILNPDAQVISKYMEYVMLKDANHYYLYAIRYPESES